MGTADGTVLGHTQILNNGPDAARKIIVLVAEGFTNAQQGDFNTCCSDFIAALQAEPWYPVIGAAINVYRVNVASDESGADSPAACPDGTTGSGISVDTYFDATFCNSGIWRCLSGDDSLVRDTLDNEVPGWDVGIVLVNTTDHGGCASGNISFSCIETGWTDVALHEMGHNFGLADEYQYWEGCDHAEPAQDHYSFGEPAEANITTVTNEATLKWRHLLSPGVPVPTMENPDCSRCDERPNVLSSDTAIGLFESAEYHHCGIYRPAYRCRMRNSSAPYCRVCAEAIAAHLENYVPATPTMEVIPDVIDFGDVGNGLTLYRSFEVRNVRTGVPGAIQVTVSAPTGGFSFAPGSVTSFTLAAPIYEPFTVQRIYVAFTAPATGTALFSGSLTVTRTDDPATPVHTVILQARSVPPPPVDTVLVMDRSGSMVEDSGVFGKRKIDIAIEAADLYVSLLKDNDKIGIVRYNHVSGAADRLLTMMTAGAPATGAGRVAARAVLDDTHLNPDGNTSIGGGIMNGSNVLDGGTADTRALVVLTDGLQNTLPDIPDGTAVVLTKSPVQRVFAVGLGLNQLEDRLNQIASVTNGTAQITGELVDEREFLLQKLYVQILADVADDAFVRDPRRRAAPGEVQETTVSLAETDVAADFIVVYRTFGPLFPRMMSVELISPSGKVIGKNDVSLYNHAEYFSAPGHVVFRWQFPMQPGEPLAHAGTWRIRVRNLVKKGYEKEYGDNANLYYSVMAKARSDLRLGGRVLQTDYRPGSAMEIILDPTLFGMPVQLADPVRAQLTGPDGRRYDLLLTRDDAGTYRTTFTDTGPVGIYHVSAEVYAVSPAGHMVTRYREMTGSIFLPVPDVPGGGSRSCRDAKAALRTLARFVDRCCERRKITGAEQLELATDAEVLKEMARRLSSGGQKD